MRKIKQFSRSGRPFGLFLSASGMFIVSTDSLFTRVAEIDGWTIAFFVGVFSVPSMSVIVWKTVGKNLASEIKNYRWPLFISSAPLFSFLRATPRHGHRLHFTLPAPLPGARYRLRFAIP